VSSVTLGAPWARFARLIHPAEENRPEGEAALRRPTSLIAVLVTCGLAAALIAGCGSGNDSDADPQELLEQTFSADAEITSGVLDLSLDADAEGEDGGTVSGTLSGPFQSTGADQLPEFDFDLSLNADAANQGLDFEGGLTITKDGAFVAADGTDYEVDEATFMGFQDLYAQSAKSQEAESEEGAALFSQLGIDPATWLTDVSNEGTEEVGGAETVHISGSADIGRIVEDTQGLAANAPGGAGELGSGQIKQLEEGVKSATVDVYTGEDDQILRRLDLALELEDPGSNDALSLSLSIGFSDVNESQEINAPEDARPLDELIPGGVGGLGGLGSGLGGLGGLEGLGGTGTGGGGGGGGGAALPEGLEGANDEYVKCVSEAGTPEEILDCARLLDE
jgi:hypothetical protein